MAPKSVTFRRHDHLVSVFSGDLLSHSYNVTFSMFFLSCLSRIAGTSATKKKMAETIKKGRLEKEAKHNREKLLHEALIESSVVEETK